MRSGRARPKQLSSMAVCRVGRKGFEQVLRAVPARRIGRRLPSSSFGAGAPLVECRRETKRADLERPVADAQFDPDCVEFGR